MRLKEIDSIRGIALFGIFLVNMLDFHSPAMYMSLGNWWKDPLDRFVLAFIDVVAQASFYPLFAFLFGFSMILFREQAMKKGRSFPRLWIRRMAALLTIGLFHAFFVWHGDILITYATTGALLLLFHNAPSRTWLFAAMSCYVPHVIIAILIGSEPTRQQEAMAQEALKHYQHGTIADIFWQRLHDWMYVNDAAGFVFIVMTLLSFGLFGGYVAQIRASLSVRIIKRVALLSFCIGLPLKLLPYWLEKNEWTEYVQDMFGGPALALFYAAGMWLVSQKRWRIIADIAACGRISITNYLLQSVLCTFLFYSYGLGLYGTVRPFVGTVGAVVIYCLQVAGSRKWLQHFSIGPVEWGWRAVTYGSRPLFRRRR
ncbi:uncharacterized protein GGR02_002368 [Anoxybacillus voinovskiensis]|uniref:DUF418 domain-containing protein n=1 Tax=Anoxybacteroides voinovskiense TaxID=230470 RepID=A0A840DMZ4_9BACL|nr:DUF418 domain-containing protein [Anoxybacillus voinovskiensis]MBB4074601.1 uncharacterized protein [Anoxybacillus voinovskiensis]GGJ71852.1 hypothetical protein GCM10008982_21440 [Anoxybacillus voinovskiensis]